MSKRNNICIQCISLQMQWTGLWFDFLSSSSTLTGIAITSGKSPTAVRITFAWVTIPTIDKTLCAYVTYVVLPAIIVRS